MADQTEYLLEVLEGELDRQKERLHALVNENVITRGEYSFLQSRRIGGVDFTPKYDFVVRICDHLGITPNDVVEEMQDEERDYCTPYEERIVDCVDGLSDEAIRFISMAVAYNYLGERIKSKVKGNGKSKGRKKTVKKNQK